MTTLQDILRRPLVTEKSSYQSGKLNRAMDFWINGNMVWEDGFQLPPLPGICLNRMYQGMTVHQIFNALPDDPSDNKGNDEGGEGDGSGNDPSDQFGDCHDDFLGMD